MRVLITGGLGFVGHSYAAYRVSAGDEVVILDNEDRGASNRLTAEWLQRHAKGQSGRLQILLGSVDTWTDVIKAVQAWGGVDVVIHAAAQSSVDVSMSNPIKDFQANGVGTVTLLEVLRQRQPQARVVFLASNKVYDVSNWPVEKSGTRYRWPHRRSGPSEQLPFATDAREPYGASKICGFYFCRAYAALYEMPIAICVPSGMYGPRQYGTAEQGWLGWFAVATELGLPIVLRGDGYQVRDMLHVEDVCQALDRLAELASRYPGAVFNLGGGPRNAISLSEALGLISDHVGKAPRVTHGDWRPCDNKVYISNIERLLGQGWSPTIPVQDGIKEVCAWVKESRTALRTLYGHGE